MPSKLKKRQASLVQERKIAQETLAADLERDEANFAVTKSSTAELDLIPQLVPADNDREEAELSEYEKEIDRLDAAVRSER